MTKYRKRVLSLLLTASMIFTMNSFAFGEEIKAGESAMEVEGTDAILSTEPQPTTETQPEEEEVVISADKVLSENLAEIEDNLKRYDYTDIVNTDYIIVFPRAVAFGGKDKPGSKNFGIDVQVYKKVSKTISGADLVSDNGVITASANDTSVVKKLTVKKAKIKAAKGATVKLDGSPLYEAKKSTFISSIKLEGDENKAFQAAMKDIFKAGKKSTEMVSANGLVAGKEATSALFTIAVYPCYVGNDADAVKLAKEAGLKIGTIDTSKTKWDKAKVKIENGDGKKATLKLTKKEGKYKGLDKAGKQTCTADTNSLKATEYFIADGNYAGNIYKQ